jgi:hypothetical protein
MKRLLGKTVNILGYEYQICELSEHLRSKMDGVCMTKQQQIEYDPDLRGMAAADVTIHELLHAIDHIMYLELGEGNVRRLGIAFSNLLINNPILLEFLLEIANKQEKNT